VGRGIDLPLSTAGTAECRSGFRPDPRPLRPLPGPHESGRDRRLRNETERVGKGVCFESVAQTPRTALGTQPVPPGHTVRRHDRSARTVRVERSPLVSGRGQRDARPPVPQAPAAADRKLARALGTAGPAVPDRPAPQLPQSARLSAAAGILLGGTARGAGDGALDAAHRACGHRRSRRGGEYSPKKQAGGRPPPRAGGIRADLRKAGALLRPRVPQRRVPRREGGTSLRSWRWPRSAESAAQQLRDRRSGPAFPPGECGSPQRCGRRFLAGSPLPRRGPLLLEEQSGTVQSLEPGGTPRHAVPHRRLAGRHRRKKISTGQRHRSGTGWPLPCPSRRQSPQPDSSPQNRPVFAEYVRISQPEVEKAHKWL